MQKLKLFLATIFGGIALLGAALPQSDKPTHSDSDKPKLTFSDDKNAADHPVPTQRMVMIGKQAVVRMTAPGCNDWNVWARVTDLFSNDKEAAIQLLRSSPSCSSFPEGMGVMVEDHSIVLPLASGRSAARRLVHGCPVRPCGRGTSRSGSAALRRKAAKDGRSAATVGSAKKTLMDRRGHASASQHHAVGYSTDAVTLTTLAGRGRQALPRASIAKISLRP
jgi:hypothetical protein